jgi:hypothetical protein
MSDKTIGPRGALGMTLLASAALVFGSPAASQAKSAAKTPKAHVTTGAATHLRGSTALLTGVVVPAGSETSYYFEYGPTTAYGSQTPTVAAGDSTTRVQVGQSIGGLTPGVAYHYDLVAVSGGVTVTGHDRTFTAGGSPTSRLVLRLDKPTAPDTYGTPVLVTGALSGLGGANAPISLQASTYPYLEPFVQVGATGTTNAAGAFSFRIRNLAVSTQFRVVMLGRLPIYSQIITERVAPSVTLRVQLTKRKGFVRLYGYVTPADVGAPVIFQLEKATRPSGRSDSTSRYVTASSAVLKRGGQTFSRFSAIVEIRYAGRYRAEVKLPRGALVSATSNSFVIRGIVPKPTRRARRAKRRRR